METYVLSNWIYTFHLLTVKPSLCSPVANRDCFSRFQSKFSFNFASFRRRKQRIQSCQSFHCKETRVNVYQIVYIPVINNLINRQQPSGIPLRREEGQGRQWEGMRGELKGWEGMKVMGKEGRGMRERGREEWGKGREADHRRRKRGPRGPGPPHVFGGQDWVLLVLPHFSCFSVSS